MLKKTLFFVLLLVVTNLVSGQNSQSIAVSVGRFNVLHDNEFTTSEWRVELRSAKRNNVINPFGGVMFNSDGASLVYWGFLHDFYITNHIIFTPSFAPGFYSQGNSKDLSLALEFRSQLELTYLFNNESRLGISFNHVSNGGLRLPNLGVESFALTYIFPLSKLLNSI